MSDFSKTIFRTAKRENPYAQIDKTVLNDQRLSWKAKGLMAFLLSKPDNWEINVQNLIRQSTDGKEAVYSGIKELGNFGYIVRVESRNQGRFARIEYLIYENPQLINPQNPADFPTGLPNSYTHPDTRAGAALIQPTTTKSPHPGKPDTVKPDTEKPHPENPPLLINDLTNNDITKNPPSIPPQQLTGVGEGQIDLTILEPVALKLFGQTNPEILAKLHAHIKEFKLDGEVIKECLKLIDTKEIKYDSYGYFRMKYIVALGATSKRLEGLAKQRQMEAALHEEYLALIPEATRAKSPTENMADMRKTLGIAKKFDIRDPALEPD